MATFSITRRKTKSGDNRYIVRYRLGGRFYPLVHAGSFGSQKEAKARRDFIAGEIANGRNPQIALQAMLTPPAPVVVETLAALGERYLTSRVDLETKTEKAHRSALEKFNAWGADRDPRSLTFMDCQEFVGVLKADLAPGTVRKYFGVVQLVLDFGGVEPNPARDKRVKLPTVYAQEPNPPTGEQFLAILDNVPQQWRLPFVLQEQTGTYLDEILRLTWGDMDVAEGKARLRFDYVKAGIRARARTLQIPEWLMPIIADTCPLEDRVAERKVFQGLKEDTGRKKMAQACRLAGIPHFSPKNLRERRASIWHHSGVPVKEYSARLGHSKASISLDVYTHTVDPGEVAVAELLARVST